jgi:hypothetical protein
MGITSRTYSDPSFGSKKVLTMLNTAAMNGTATIAEDQRITFMQAVKVTDWQVTVTTAGNGTSRDCIIGKSIGGTGAIVAYGTITVGTASADTVTDGSISELAFSAGDDIVIGIGGTGATVAVVCPTVQYLEAFVVGDE